MDKKLYERYKKIYRELILEEAKLSFFFHAFFYFLMNILIIYINLQFTPYAIWFLYPLLIWGVGVFIHYLRVFHYLEKKLIKKEEKFEKKIMRKLKK